MTRGVGAGPVLCTPVTPTTTAARPACPPRLPNPVTLFSTAQTRANRERVD